MDRRDSGVKVSAAKMDVFKAEDAARDEAEELREQAKKRGIVFAPRVSVERMKKRLAED